MMKNKQKIWLLSIPIVLVVLFFLGKLAYLHFSVVPYFEYKIGRNIPAESTIIEYQYDQYPFHTIWEILVFRYSGDSDMFIKEWGFKRTEHPDFEHFSDVNVIRGGEYYEMQGIDPMDFSYWCLFDSKNKICYIQIWNPE